MTTEAKVARPAREVCPLCGGQEPFAFKERHSDPEVTYSLWECAVCLGQFWEPFENPGAGWYEHDERYASRNNDPILDANEKHVGTLEFLAPMKGRVLDVGCGVGNFLAYAETRGWEGWGIDFDADAIKAGKETFGLAQLEVSDLADFTTRHPEQRFDLVTFFDVFEHLDNHELFLAQVKKLLPPGGRIALSVPYRHAWRFLVPADLPPRHLTRWDDQSLGYVLNHHGFEVRMITRLPASLYYLALKLKFRYGSWTSFGLVKRAKDRSSAPSSSARSKQAARVQILQKLAKTKDLLLFGLPGLFLWIALRPLKKRYTDLYVVAQLQP